MRILYATVHVYVGHPYNCRFDKAFRVKQGESYMRQGIKLGNIMLAEFVESQFRNPKSKDYDYIDSISTIKVDRISI